MATETKTITIRMPVDLMERMNAVADNRSAFIIEAVNEKLNPVKVEDLTDREKRDVMKGAKKLSDIMQDLILQEAANRKNFLSTIDNETFAKLVASRLPKELVDEGELDADVLSLSSCLEMLPSIEDLTAELNKVKGKLYKAERERDINLKLLEHGKGRVGLGELMEVVYRGAVEYVVSLIARRNLPGFGDGGGLPETAYVGISDEVRRRMLDVNKDGMRVFGVK